MNQLRNELFEKKNANEESKHELDINVADHKKKN